MIKVNLVVCQVVGDLALRKHGDPILQQGNDLHLGLVGSHDLGCNWPYEN